MNTSGTEKVLKHDHKMKFSQYEDQRLTQLVSIFKNDWGTISKYMPNRTGRQCRERWNHYLAPHISLLPWTQNEDDLLLQKYHEIGPKWKEMVPFFTGRTDVSLKTRCNRLLRIAQRVAQTKTSSTALNQPNNLQKVNVFDDFLDSFDYSFLQSIDSKENQFLDIFFDEAQLFDPSITFVI